VKSPYLQIGKLASGTIEVPGSLPCHRSSEFEGTLTETGRTGLVAKECAASEWRSVGLGGFVTWFSPGRTICDCTYVGQGV